MAACMADADRQRTPETFGLTDDDLACHRTVFASYALNGMVVVVTGATGGIGRAIAWLFARLGAHVVLVGRNKAKLDALRARLTQHALSVSSFAADIRQPAEVRSLFDSIWKAQGRVDSLVNSPAVNFRRPRSTSQ
jgi:citronellol/citronellal dehydrogenase